MLRSTNLEPILATLRPDAPQGSWAVSEGALTRWNTSILGNPPTQSEVDSWEAHPTWWAAQGERSQRRAQEAQEAQAFRDLDASWSSLTLAQSNALLRRLVRYAARLERRIRELEGNP